MKSKYFANFPNFSNSCPIFSLSINQACPVQVFPADLFTFTKKMFNGKLYFLRCVKYVKSDIYTNNHL